MFKSKFVLAALFIAPLAVYADTTYSVTITVTQDEEDELWLTGNTLEWYEIDGSANGGVAGGSDVPVTPIAGIGASTSDNNPYILVSGTDSSDSSLDFTDSDWYNGVQGADCNANGFTCPFTDSDPAYEFSLESPYTLTGLTGSVTLTTQICDSSSDPSTACGGTDQDPLPDIVYQPSVPTASRTDGSTLGTLVIDLDDTPETGTHEFEITLTWTDASSTPEPATFGVMGIALAILGLAKKMRGSVRGRSS